MICTVICNYRDGMHVVVQDQHHNRFLCDGPAGEVYQPGEKVFVVNVCSEGDEYHYMIDYRVSGSF